MSRGGKNMPAGRLTLREKGNPKAETISGGALWTARRGDGSVVRFRDARVFNLSIGDRETEPDEVLAMIESGEYFVSVIVDDEED